MRRSERRLLIDTSTLGVALTILVTFLEFSGLLAAPERFFYDFRARHCQRYTPRPTTQLVHVDIDDNSLLALGHWPWPRSKLAEIVDELRIGGARTMVLDVILSDPSPYDPAIIATALAATTQPASTQPKTAPALTPAATRPAAVSPSTAPAGDTIIIPRPVNNDEMLASALERFKTAVVPLSLSINAVPNNEMIYLAMVDEMEVAPWTKPERLVDKLISRGFKEPTAKEAVAKRYVYARNEGMFKRIALESGESVLSYEELRSKILPKVDPQIVGSVPLQVLREQSERFAAVHAVRQFAIKIPEKYPKLIDTREEIATLKVLSKSGWATGFFDFVRPVDGTLRFIPLLVNHHGYAYPQLGLSLACAMLNVEPKDLIVTKKSITIPCDPPIVIPVHTQDTYRGSYDMFIDIPWFGPPVDSGWQRMYDWKNFKDTTQHTSVQFIWDACDTRHKIAVNNHTADDAMARVINDLEPKLLPRILAVRQRDPFDPTSRFEAIDTVMNEMKDSGFLTMMRSKPMLLLRDLYSRFNDFDFFRPMRLQAREEEKNFIDAFRSLRLIKKENTDHKAYLELRRAQIRERVEGKAALIGWTAVGSIADVIPTSLHSQCPGVVAHGVIFNAIMTRDFWERPPSWVNPLVTALMGLMVTGIVAILPPWRALAATIAVAAGYSVFNGYYVFDKHNLIVGMAGPLTAALAVWAGGTLARYILEANLRAQVTRNFSMRVDPQLVRYVLEHDPRVHGQVKELTVVFTDLAGFTSLSEQLKEETVPLLNEYMGLMVPVIRKHKGYLNKFLGDGIMYFFGAPYDNPTHAFDAVASVLVMQEVMVEFNRSLTERNLPNMAVRAGISAGNMVVGDAGAEDTHDYTVLGDAVNLGARLEPANKVFGTQILVNARARELVGEKVLFRPIGRIQVMGKKEGVMTYEPLALAEKASEKQKELAGLTGAVVDAFMKGDFEACLAAIAKLEAAVGASKLGNLYRRLSEQYQRDGAPAGFDGQIVMSEK